MPQIKQIPEEEMPEEKVKSSNERTYTDADVDRAVKMLIEILPVYKARIGIYLPGAWKKTNEGRIKHAIFNINGLLEYYNKYGSLTPAQMDFARKLILNGARLI